MSDFLLINDARISFPQLWHDDVRVVNGKEQVYPKSATILLSKTKHADTLGAINAQMKAAINASESVKKAVAQAGMKAFKGICLRGAGEEGWRDEYPADHMVLKANCKKGSKPPLALHADKTHASEKDDPFYSGCRVNVKVQIWLQDNQWGRRINCKLVALQFAGDDEPLDASYISEDVAGEGFDALPGFDENDAFGDTTSDFDASQDAEEQADDGLNFLN